MAARSVKSAAKSKSTKMLKKVLVLLEKNNNQIEELRKEVKNSLSDIMDEVKKQSRPHPTASLQKRSKKVRVPAVCKTALRRVYNRLNSEIEGFGFYLDESVDSSNNSEVLEDIELEIYRDCGGEEKCNWSKAQIKEAFKRYFLTKYETEQKKRKKVYEKHKAKCRRQGRKRAKLTQRLRALKEIQWSKKARAEMAKVMYMTFMSSEESEYGSESEEEKCYSVKKFAWESDLFMERKRTLDEFYASQQSKQSQEHRVKRVRKAQLERREPPRDCPDWACNNRNNNQEHDFQGQ